jgi:signal peptidase II
MSVGSSIVARWPYFAIAAGVIGGDQLTKALAHTHLRGRPAVEVVPGFLNLAYSRNPGGLFGFFGDLAPTWRLLLLTALPVIAIVLIGSFIVRAEPSHRTTRLGLGLILGGAVGNLIDRVLRGEVVDFLDVYASSTSLADWLVRQFGTAHWPTFNVADSAIVVGAGLLVLDMFRKQPVEQRGAPAPGTARNHETG